MDFQLKLKSESASWSNNNGSKYYWPVILTCKDESKFFFTDSLYWLWLVWIGYQSHLRGKIGKIYVGKQKKYFTRGESLGGTGGRSHAEQITRTDGGRNRSNGEDCINNERRRNSPKDHPLHKPTLIFHITGQWGEWNKKGSTRGCHVK